MSIRTIQTLAITTANVSKVVALTVLLQTLALFAIAAAVVFFDSGEGVEDLFLFGLESENIFLFDGENDVISFVLELPHISAANAMAGVPAVPFPPEALAVQLQAFGVLAVAVLGLLLALERGCFLEENFLNFVFAVRAEGRGVSLLLPHAVRKDVDFLEREGLSPPAVVEFFREVIRVQYLGWSVILEQGVEEDLVLVVN